MTLPPVLWAMARCSTVLAVEGTSPPSTAPLTGEALAFASRVEAATTCDELKQIGGDIAVAFRETGFNPDTVSLTLNERREALGCVPAVTLDAGDPEGTVAAIGALTDCLQILAVEQEALDRARDGLNRGDTAAVDLYYSFTTAAGARFEARCDQG